jgi:hypothetical protein
MGPEASIDDAPSDASRFQGGRGNGSKEEEASAEEEVKGRKKATR